tara:strand:- start:11 stop:1528 length:1518 start_codon:yes stop_codon:yes gene_type:complete
MTRTNQRALANTPDNGVSVLDYGAVGDGVTDDTAAIQAAINQAAVFVNPDVSGSYGKGSTVIFPKGLYKVTSTIALGSASFLMIEGQGPLTTSILTDIDGDLFQGYSVNDISIKNIGLINTSTSGSKTGWGINVGGEPLVNSVPAFARYLRFENLQISGFLNGIRVSGALASSFRDCRVGGTGTSGGTGILLGDGVITTHIGNGINKEYSLTHNNTDYPVVATVDGLFVAATKASPILISFAEPPANGSKIRIIERFIQGTTVSGDNIYISRFDTGLKNFVEGAQFGNLIIETCTVRAIEAEASLNAHLYLENNTEAIRTYRPLLLSTNQATTSLWGSCLYENNEARNNTKVTSPAIQPTSLYKLVGIQAVSSTLGQLTFSGQGLGREDVNPLYMPLSGYGTYFTEISGKIYFDTSLAAGKRIDVRVEYSSFNSPGNYTLYFSETITLGGVTGPGIHYPVVNFLSARQVTQGTRISISASSDQASMSAYSSAGSGAVSSVLIKIL